MFRRTLLVFLTTVLLCLLLTVGYAVLGLSGPETAVENAEDAFADGRYADCVRLCTLAEDSIGPSSDPSLRSRLLDLRCRAYLEVENLVPALADLEQLRIIDPDDVDLAIQQIRCTIIAGDSRRGLQLAEAFLADHPEDQVALELAGEACQANYQGMVAKLRDELGIQFNEEANSAAFAGLRGWLYRDPDDPVARKGFETFTELVRKHQPQTYAAGSYNGEIRAIRSLIQRSQDYFRRSMEVEGRPVGAYIGLAYALEQGRRYDDLHALALIYLHRYEHVYTIEAVLDLCEIFARERNHAAVIDVCERFVPLEGWRERLAAGRIDSQVRRVLLRRARAHRALNDRDGLERLVATANEMQATEELSLEPELHMIRALAADAAGAINTVNAHLSAYANALRKLPQTEDVLDERKATAAFLIDVGQRGSYSRQFFEWQYTNWRSIDRGSVEPIKGLIRFLLEHGEAGAALVHARNGLAAAGHDDEYLRLYARVVDANRALAERGSDALLRRCVELDELTPNEADDILLMPVAELALERGHPEIARACAQRAARVFNWAIWPRVLEARAAFALDDPARAAQAAKSLLTFHPTSPVGLKILTRARGLLGQSTDDLLFQLLLSGSHDVEVLTGVLQRASRRGDLALAAQIAKAIERDAPDDPRALLMVADVQAAQGLSEDARATVHRAAMLSADGDPDVFLPALRRYFLMTALASDDQDEILSLFERVLALHRDDTDSLFEIASALAGIGRTRDAYCMISPVLTEAGHALRRSGQHFLLGGKLALELGSNVEAERLLTQAVTFEDGQEASRLLTLLLLRDDRGTQAADTYWRTEVEDLTSACLNARFGGDAGASISWARDAIAKDPVDVPARCLLALLAPDAQTPPALLDLVTGEHKALLELLTFLGEPAFAKTAVELARTLHARHEDDPFCTFLHARAESDAGDDPRALELLEDLIDQATGHPEKRFVAAFDEALRIVERSKELAAEHQELLTGVAKSTLADGGPRSPRLLAHATRLQAMKFLTTAEGRDEAIEELAKLWMQYPARSANALAQVDVLAHLGRVDLAIRLCNAIEPGLPPEARDRFLGTYFSLLTTQLAAGVDSGVVEAGARKASGIVRQEGAVGSVVQFLVTFDESTYGSLAEVDDPKRKARLVGLLDGHVDMVAAGKDTNVAMLSITLARLGQLVGREEALQRIDRLLRADPSLVAVWALRARWLFELHDTELALASLRWLYDCAPSDPAVLDCVTMAARADQLEDRDVEALAHVSPELADSPAGRLARGLVDFRTGRPEQAVEALRDAPAQPDGSQLYFHAHALLQIGQFDAARALFAELERDYPDASLSENAGHFARQLMH